MIAALVAIAAVLLIGRLFERAADEDRGLRESTDRIQRTYDELRRKW